MSVYIKGVTPPKRCSDCQFLEGDYMDGLCHAANKWLDDDEHWTWYVYSEGDADFSKPCNCPLVPVPPHGDLIDREALPWEKQGLMLTDPDEWGLKAWDIEHAPTIIPADKEETE